ncbi:hypothetical protein DL766_005418 [Monosporascus sp. MC13-8B]|nr:hypothetical protein DL766_005418 [Monosporascus sp. MC13-8B]
MCLSLHETNLVTGGREPFYGPYDFYLGTALDLESRARRCDGCRSIFETTHAIHIQKKDGGYECAVTAHLRSAQPRLIILSGNLDGVQSTDFASRLANIQKLYSTHCFSTERVVAGEKRGRQCDAEFVNVELIRKWMRRCDAAHDHTCGREYDMFLLPTAELSFIDVEDLCIVTPKSTVRYAALSYVWGAVAVLRALKSNIADLRQPGAFSSPQYQLPRTIWDAVTLCSRLGIRYLWVDSVCIVQDDPVSQGEQLRAMSAVYGQACFTIAVLSAEHANAGIYRVGPTDFAYKPQEVVTLPSRTLILATSPPAIGLNALDISGIKWNTRGWTLQELVFSRRVLAMGKLATWACFGDQWTEDVESASELDDGPVPTDKVNDNKLGAITWPCVSAYSRLAKEYGRRDLSCSSDAISAFSGVMTPMSQWFPGGLLYGIAEFTFDIGLLWSTHRTGASLRCDPGTSPFAGGAPKFPTWSWISWTGELLFNLWDHAEDYLFPRGPLLVTPLVAWQKCLVSSGAWIDIDNSYHVVRTHFCAHQSPPVPIPEGWTKHFDSAEGEFYYQHSSHAHVVPHPRFAYPIPPSVRYRDIDQRAYHPYLRYRGMLARVQLAIDATTRSGLSATLRECGATPEVDITMDDGRWGGRIKLNLEKGTDVPAADMPYEIIVISEAALYLKKAAYAPYMFQEVGQRTELEGVEVYEMVNVLWIGRCEGGMAYRKGLGRVWKPAWHRAVLEEVELLLT